MFSWRSSNTLTSPFLTRLYAGIAFETAIQYSAAVATSEFLVLFSSIFSSPAVHWRSHVPACSFAAAIAIHSREARF
jgi:DMSO reductase anchor subunit